VTRAGRPTDDGRAVPDAVAPPPHHPRFPLLDGMRAVAVLLVVIVHTWVTSPDPGGTGAWIFSHFNIGVTLFFLLSGFLLYRPFIAHRGGGGGAPGIRSYAKRRLLRILPAYWLVVTALALLPGITATDGSWLSQYALTFTLTGSPGWVCADCGLIQTWSLVAEATFYAALPLYVLAAGWLVSRRPAAWVQIELGLLTTFALATGFVQFFVYDGSPPPLFGGSLLSFGLWFALGMALAVASVALSGGRASSPAPPLTRMPSVVYWLAAALVFVVMARILPAITGPFVRDQQLFAFICFGLVSLLLMLPPILAPDGLARAVLGNRLIAWVGLVSYGIFLWHIAVIRLVDDSIGASLPFVVRLPAVLALTIPIAAASYYLLERPLLRLKYRRIGVEKPMQRASSPERARPRPS
jgi:peptidoglycan/LPS O-acetylase OafA/YrhL